MEFLLLGLLMACAFLVRLAFILGPCSDSDWHLWQIEKSRRFGFGRHDVFNSIREGRNGYPSLGHWLVSLFPARFRIVTAYLLNIASDCAIILVVYAVARSTLGSGAVVSDVSYGLVAAALAAFSPMLLPVTPRMKAFGARTLGALESVGYFFFLYQGLVVGHTWGYVASALIFLLILMSSQFAVQTVFFFSLVLSFIYRTPIPGLLPILTAAAGWFIPRIGVRDNLCFTINHWIWYVRNKEKKTTATGRNRLADLLSAPRYLFSHPTRFFTVFLQKNSFTSALYSLPVLPALLYWTISDWSSLVPPERQDLMFLFAMVSASFIVFLLISTPWLAFLGEAERYFEYTCGAAYILFVYRVIQAEQSPAWIALIMLIQTAGLLVNLIWNMRGDLESAILGKDSNLEELKRFLGAQSRGRIMSIPIKLAMPLGTDPRLDGFQFYYDFVSKPRLEGFPYMTRDTAFYNFPRPDLAHFISVYGLDWLVVSRDSIRHAGKAGLEYPLQDYPKRFDNGVYEVYDLRSKDAADAKGE